MPIANYRNTNHQSRNRLTAHLTLVASCLLILLGSAKSLAVNPWTSSPLAWSPASFTMALHSWSSWETTRGGTFGGSSPSPSLALSGPRLENLAPAPAPLGATRETSIDPVMIRAGSIAEQRARPHSTMLCWRYVKQALVAAGSVSSYPQTTCAKQAGDELVHSFGFVRLPVSNPENAPVGSVLVYGGPGPGHVELRTAHGFVSDFRSPHPVNMPFIGAFTRLEKPRIATAQLAFLDNSDS